MNDSTLDQQKCLKRPLSKEEIINHRKRVRRDSLTFSVTDLIDENIATVKKDVKSQLITEKDLPTNKVSIGIQTDDCHLDESEFVVEIQSAMTESTLNSIKIDEYTKVLKPKIDSPGSYGNSKMEEIKIRSPEKYVNNNNKNVTPKGILLNHNEKDNSPKDTELGYSSSPNINGKSVANIEVLETVFVLNSSSNVNTKTPNDNTKTPNDEKLICHNRQIKTEKKIKEVIVQPIAHSAQVIEEKNVQEDMKNLSIREKEVSPLETTINYNDAVEDGNKTFSKNDDYEIDLSLKENEKGTKLDNEVRDKNKNKSDSSHNINPDTGSKHTNKGFSEIFRNADNLHSQTNDSQMQNIESILCDRDESEEIMKITKIRVNDSDSNSPDIAKNENINIKNNSKFNGTETKENTSEGKHTKATQNEEILDSENKTTIINCQELEKNIVQAEYQVEKISISGENAVKSGENKDFSTITQGKIDRAENEEFEVHSKLENKGNYGKQVFIGSDTKKSNDIFDMYPKTPTEYISSSQMQGKIVTNKENTPDIPVPKQELKRIHKEPTVGQSSLCSIKPQSQIKVDGISSSKTTEDLQREDLSKSISKENNQNKKQTTGMNDSVQNKMNKTDKKNEKLKVGENYGRINYLVQASRKVFKNDESISSQLGSLAISFGRRLPQVRLDPLLKREMCKGCGVYLVYGVNAKVRHKSKRHKHLVITCLTCHTIKRFVTNPKHKLWSEQPEAKV